MKLASFEAIVRALNDAGVRYLVAGGLAVNAHGYLRFTKEADLVLDLTRNNAERALANGFIDPASNQPYQNNADLSAAGLDGFFVEAGVINWREDAPGGTELAISRPTVFRLFRTSLCRAFQEPTPSPRPGTITSRKFKRTWN